MVGRRHFMAAMASVALWSAPAAHAANLELDAAADATLSRLLSTQPAAEALASKARGVLIFPKIVKAGALIGGAAGEGVLRIGDKPHGRFLSTAVSYGLQIGATTFGYVMFFMDDASLAWLDTSAGWEVGVGPTVVVADDAIARRLTTTTAQEGVYVFFIDQTGYFAGAGIEGTKITRLD